MATRVQSLKIALGLSKEATYNTASADWLCFPKVNADILSPISSNETDETWIGKHSEFATQLFKTNTDVAGRVSKFGSSEWLTYGLCYALGDVTETTGTYVIVPMDPGVSIQLPSFSYVEILPEGGSTAIDNLYLGAVVDTFAINFQSGPGLKSVSADMSFRASGSVTTPSGVTVPAPTQEHHSLASAMSLVVNGVDYGALATGISGSLSISNSLLADEGYYISSGVDAADYATRGRLEYGVRKYAFEFTARLLTGSLEYTKLRNLTTGPATLTFPYDTGHNVVIELHKVGFTHVENTSVGGGLAGIRVIGEVMEDPTLGIITVTAKPGITGICG